MSSNPEQNPETSPSIKTKGRRSYSYRSLDPKRIIDTAVAIKGRIIDRFPQAGLGRIATEVELVSLESAERAHWCAQPQWQLRALAIILTLFGVGGICFFVVDLAPKILHEDISQLLQDVYNIMNDTILLGLGLVFLWSAERRIKRDRALKALHELRSLAHIIDMHQFTKDPESLMQGKAERPVEKGPMTPEDLIRYLIFCTDLLALVGKIAAVYAQDLEDGTVLGAVNEIEELSTTLSQKIWQKITIIEREHILSTKE